VISGSEEGWANASHDSRRADKQRDIRATITAMREATENRQRGWESELEDKLTDVTLEAVLKGGGDRSILHGSERFRANYESWLRSL